ncbi:hypothetical protein BK011_09125 [Tenericutes bacterium MZ-XQ]|jgi:hypothetical protein|nr:hypothetical protein BK011_09125 [Tenericutes bacterium MZ-XQ]
MKKYLDYLIHKKWLQTLVMTIIPTLIMVLIITSSRFARYSSGGFRDPSELLISIIFMMIVMIVIVIFRFSSLRSAKEVDLYYALPISRQKLFLTHFIYGLLQVIFVWTILYFFSLITVIAKTNGGYAEGWLFLIYFIALFYIIILYSITVFVFLRANTIFDGIAFIILFNVLFLFVAIFFTGRVFLFNTNFSEPFFLNPYYSVAELTAFMTKLSNQISSNDQVRFENASLFIIINTIFYASSAVFAFLYSYRQINETKTESIGQISSSKLGYKFYIPAILITAIQSIFFIGSAVTFVLVIIFVSAGFIGFFIYKRGLKITWVDTAYVLIPTLIGMIIGVMMNGF